MGSAKKFTIYSDLEITKPSGICSDDFFFADSIWRFTVSDDDPNNGIIEDNEIDDPHASTYYAKMCDFGNTIHDAGNHTFNITLPDSSTISKTMIEAPRGLALDELPSVTNLSASWNTDDDITTVSWTPAGFSYPDGTFMEVRLYLYKNGQYINNQIRASKLQITLTSFTFWPDMTIYFDTGNVDQILVDVRVITQYWSTVTRSRQTLPLTGKQKP